MSIMEKYIRFGMALLGDHRPYMQLGLCCIVLYIKLLHFYAKVLELIIGRTERLTMLRVSENPTATHPSASPSM